MDINRITIIEIEYKNKKNEYFKLEDRKMKLNDYLDYITKIRKCKKIKYYKCYEVKEI